MSESCYNRENKKLQGDLQGDPVCLRQQESCGGRILLYRKKPETCFCIVIIYKEVRFI